jgi:hypothetical protein
MIWSVVRVSYENSVTYEKITLQRFTAAYATGSELVIDKARDCNIKVQ